MKTEPSRARFSEPPSTKVWRGGCMTACCGFTDDEVYERRSMGGGLGYTEARLREVWSGGLQVHVVRQMTKPGAESGLFGENFLWVVLAQKA